MKKIAAVFLIVFVVGLIVGFVNLSKIDILTVSGIVNDSDYLEYVSLKNEGTLDENNQQQITFYDPEKIRVSFADNQNLDVSYYYDTEMLQEISDTTYLLPGDTIYKVY